MNQKNKYGKLPKNKRISFKLILYYSLNCGTGNICVICKIMLDNFASQLDILVVLGRSSIIIDNQSFTSLILINRLQNWQSIIIGKVTPSGKI